MPMTDTASPRGHCSRLNVFIVETRFQALVSLLIAKSQPDSDNLICHYREEIGSFLGRFDFVRAKTVDTRLKKGLWRRQRRIRNVLNTVLAEIRQYPDARDVHFHTTKLQGPLFNYYVNFLRKRVTWATMHFNIITDGTFNFHRGDMTDSDRRVHDEKPGNLLYRLFGLDFYPYDGDRFGIEAAVIERIYLLPNAPHEYDASRVFPVPIVDLGICQQENGGEPRALVIGEKLRDKDYFTAEDEVQVSAQIAELLQARGITRVDYVKHPLAIYPDLQQPEYRELKTDFPVEVCIMENRYRVIVGVISTALFTARLLSDSECEVLSVGLERCTGRNDLAHKIKKAYQGMGVTIIE